MISLLDYQEQPKQRLVGLIRNKESSLLVAPTRTGKTYGILAALAEAQSLGYIKEIDPIDIEKMYSGLLVCPKGIVIQSTRVALKAGLKDFKVCTYRALSSSFGETFFLDWITTSLGNIEPVWRQESMPDYIWLDECQFVKNAKAQITKVILAYIKQGGLLLLSSATPFARIIEAEVACKALGLCSSSSWPAYAREICGYRSNPEDFSPAAMKRLNEALEASNRLIRYENIKYKHRVFNRCIAIDFRDQAELIKYNELYQKLQEELRRNNPFEPAGIRRIWVAMGKWREASEILRAPRLAEQAIARHKEGHQVIIVSNFVEALRGVWTALIKAGVRKESIGHVTGKDSDELRQKYVDMFQEGKLDYLLLSMKAGGVGLSLHHELAIARPRYVILPFTWSPMDLAQVLGRAHGPTSLSTTHQDVISYKGTIEDRVKEKVEAKSMSMKELIGAKTSLVEVFINNVSSDVLEKELEEFLADDEKDEDGNKVTFDLDIFNS